MRVRLMSKLLIAISTILAAYLSLSKLGGLMVFGITGLLEFLLFGLPVLAFPIQLAVFWNIRTGTALSCLLTVVYGLTQIHMVGFSPTQIARNNSFISLYVLNSTLLLLALVLERRTRRNAQEPD